MFFTIAKLYNKSYVSKLVILLGYTKNLHGKSVSNMFDYK
jgi:hypothetical protein